MHFVRSFIEVNGRHTGIPEITGFSTISRHYFYKDHELGYPAFRTRRRRGARPSARRDAGLLQRLLPATRRHHSYAAKLASGAEILVARLDDRIVGFAGFGANYAGPGLKPGFFLKDLYVTKSQRGKSIGKALMSRIAAIAVERGFTRIDWTASRSDEKLIRFYGALGASLKEDRVFFRLDGEGLNELARAK
ncbi:GNAT family N-acetyltransferase (plasmid) [Aliirhizobium terrae]|uniref:GNAT family N-acetyltransferase n=1 Tax=Terrirhizobium terrae TaxID=2926709 RepID=UPI002574C176|nr:GNAT family N-acetyltransferase [Rhizobium sp. CC-CFT758]WJH38169.1 GNAT family N-acetyltransferase [Rhizobium sp. CC-CFT758]